MSGLPEDQAPCDRLTIALRAYTETAQHSLPDERSGKRPRRPLLDKPSPWVLVFDTETTTDASQALRFGAYQVYEGDMLYEAGLFHEPGALAEDEVAVLADCANTHRLVLRTRESFVDEIFYKIGYELRATIVGLNLPFDLSRIAIRHGSARRDMRGGFTFTLSRDKRWPAVQIKHLSQRISLLRFAAPFRQRSSRSERKRGHRRPVRRGFFVDIRTLAAALYSQSFSLGRLADFLKVRTRKLATDEHGQTLSADYVNYAVQDVQATWECYDKLRRRYQGLGLTNTPVHKIFSEASLGKAYLKAMGVKPWREIQTCPPDLLAKIMSAYFGGRSEVRIRRELRQVMLCDFLSMYPTVCTLMGLWRFVIAQGMTWRDGTDEIRELLDNLTLSDLQNPLTWPKLTVLVQVVPDKDIFPVRARYEEMGQATIGLNHLTSDVPLWFTFADCLASKLLNGRAPEIANALIFEPNAKQQSLKPVAISGNPAYTVDPRTDDFYRHLIELRTELKHKRECANGPNREALDTEQNALKIAANATSYGVFVEVNVKERAKRQRTLVHNGVFDPFEVETDKEEAPGIYFHPLLATLITGAARLMLAITERLVHDRGLEWSFCDTDSMAIAKPEELDGAEFSERVQAIVAWFEALNPYAFGGSVLKIEDVNSSLDDPTRYEPLYCWAVSAKRYALFNLDHERRPILRKASAHGLGHLLAPYGETNPALHIPKPKVALNKLGVELWQHDLWWTILRSSLNGDPDTVDLGFHPALEQTAVSRYAATTPMLLAWFNRYNEARPYSRQVKPFNFLLSPSLTPFGSNEESGALTDGKRSRLRRQKRALKPVAPFERNPSRESLNPFDRETGDPVPVDMLKTYRQALAQYHLHPESKFLNGDYLDRGTTQRRHVRVLSVEHIGKEANRWEEQFHVGLDPTAQIGYGIAPEDHTSLSQDLKRLAKQVGQRALARELGISRNYLARLMDGVTLQVEPSRLKKLQSGLLPLLATEEGREKQRDMVRSQLAATIASKGLIAVAGYLRVDPSNLLKIVSGKRGIPSRLLSQIAGLSST